MRLPDCAHELDPSLCDAFIGCAGCILRGGLCRLVCPLHFRGFGDAMAWWGGMEIFFVWLCCSSGYVCLV